jgi:hypothetical protein
MIKLNKLIFINFYLYLNFTFFVFVSFSFGHSIISHLLTTSLTIFSSGLGLGNSRIGLSHPSSMLLSCDQSNNLCSITKLCLNIS